MVQGLSGLRQEVSFEMVGRRRRHFSRSSANSSHSGFHFFFLSVGRRCLLKEARLRPRADQACSHEFFKGSCDRREEVGAMVVENLEALLVEGGVAVAVEGVHGVDKLLL